MQSALHEARAARRYGVATAKVISWIRQGELAALNLANCTCTRPRFSVTPEALEQFERSRLVVPESVPSTRVRRRPVAKLKRFFR